MKLPIETKPTLWGLAIGAAAVAFIGFNWGGWSTASSAEAMAQTRANEAVVAVLAPMCVDRFERATDATANRAALIKADSWSQASFIEKGGWATAGTDRPSAHVSAVAKACAALLVQS